MNGSIEKIWRIAKQIQGGENKTKGRSESLGNFPELGGSGFPFLALKMTFSVKKE